MTDPPHKQPPSSFNLQSRPHQDLTTALIARAEHDLIFTPRIMGESLYMLQRYFQDFIKAQLESHSVTFGDHPLLLPFMETHARELADFVLAGVGLNHSIRLPDLEKLGPDPERMRRLDLWDSFSAHVKNAEDHFLSEVGGLQRILESVEDVQSLRKDVPNT